MAVTETIAPEAGRDFIRDIVAADLAAGRHTAVVTRFPPEPNGYLHIGHAKSICLNFGVAQEFGGRCHLRFDDTNPTKEEQEYIDAIERDVRWLGFDWGAAPLSRVRLFRAALRMGRAPDPRRQGLCRRPVAGRDARDARHADRARPQQPVSRPHRRGEPRSVPPHARRRVPERRARAARQDRHGVRQHQPARPGALPHPARHPSAHRTTWCIYPSYDFAHGQSDAIEGITHSICTLEFEDHRPLYDWFLENLPVPSRPRQYEFARLNLTYTVLSKRVLTELVREGHVGGWDDPRMPTLAGLRRRGVPPEAIRDFVRRVGVAKANSVVDVGMFEHRGARGAEQVGAAPHGGAAPAQGGDRELSRRAERGARSRQPSRRSGRRHAAHPLRARALYRARRLHGEPAEEILPAVAGPRGAAALRLFHHLPRGGEERGRRGGRAALHLRSGDARRQRARRAQGAGDASTGCRRRTRCRPRCGSTIRCSRAPIRTPANFAADLNPNSLEVLADARIEPALAESNADEPVQFERQGYFCRDPDSTPGRLVFNRTVGLRDTWAKVPPRAADRGLAR